MQTTQTLEQKAVEILSQISDKAPEAYSTIVGEVAAKGVFFLVISGVTLCLGIISGFLMTKTFKKVSSMGYGEDNRDFFLGWGVGLTFVTIVLLMLSGSTLYQGADRLLTPNLEAIKIFTR